MKGKIIVSLIAAIILLCILTIAPLSNNFSDITFTGTIENDEITEWNVTEIQPSPILGYSKEYKGTLINVSKYVFITEVFIGKGIGGNTVYIGDKTIEILEDPQSIQYTIKRVENNDYLTYKVDVYKNGTKIDFAQAPITNMTVNLSEKL